jgi:ribosomal protein S18 acetylase RimI-like enzyme
MIFLYDKTLLSNRLGEALVRQQDHWSRIRDGNSDVAVFDSLTRRLYFCPDWEQATEQCERDQSWLSLIESGEVNEIFSYQDISDSLSRLNVKFAVTPSFLMLYEVATDAEFVESVELQPVEACIERFHEYLRQFTKEAWNRTVSEAELAEIVAPGRRDFRLFSNAVGIVGMCAMTRIFGDARCISYIYIDPRYRGRGAGTEMTKAVTSLVLEKYNKPFLYVRCDNTIARRLYQRCGYHEVAVEFHFEVQKV